MSREQEVMQMRKPVGVPAEQAGRLLDVTGRRGENDADAGPAEDKLAVLESLMWKLHRRHLRLKGDIGHQQAWPLH